MSALIKRKKKTCKRKKKRKLVLRTISGFKMECRQTGLPEAVYVEVGSSQRQDHPSSRIGLSLR